MHREICDAARVHDSIFQLACRGGVRIDGGSDSGKHYCSDHRYRFDFSNYIWRDLGLPKYGIIQRPERMSRTRQQHPKRFNLPAARLRQTKTGWANGDALLAVAEGDRNARGLLAKMVPNKREPMLSAIRVIDIEIDEADGPSFDPIDRRPSRSNSGRSWRRPRPSGQPLSSIILIDGHAVFRGLIRPDHFQ
jgi:hypothetical protein